LRAVAQPGSASVWGTGGRGFESRLPDIFRKLKLQKAGNAIGVSGLFAFAAGERAAGFRKSINRRVQEKIALQHDEP
jgi:hypothetical protein